PDVLDVPGGGGGFEHAAVDAPAAHHDRVHAVRHHGTVVQHVTRVHGERGVTHGGRARIAGGAVGGHDLVVDTEAQGVVAQSPLEVQPAHFALVLMVDDRT